VLSATTRWWTPGAGTREVLHVRLRKGQANAQGRLGSSEQERHGTPARAGLSLLDRRHDAAPRQRADRSDPPRPNTAPPIVRAPGRLTRTARRWTLHLPARWPWQTDFAPWRQLGSARQVVMELIAEGQRLPRPTVGQRRIRWRSSSLVCSVESVTGANQVREVRGTAWGP
jgi:hypothetical protein